MQFEENGGVRKNMERFWTQHSMDASFEEMMLDSKAETLSLQELPEILSLLPDYRGKDVLELGAGIGRFTGVLAEKAASVTAVDFMEKFIAKNKETHGHRGNCSFLQADATKLKLDEESYDMAFSNWLLMYLSDREVQELLQNLLTWLREDGYLFFRESCFHQSGDFSRNLNPTKYRDPAKYFALLNSVAIPVTGEENCYFGFETVLSTSVKAYVELKSNRNQICWLLQKKRRNEAANHGFKTFQEFLDNQQYSKNGVLRYEKIFGKHFISTGGRETTEEFVDLLDLKPGQKVLDVGSGIGGSAFYMSQKHDVHVLGIDLSSNVVSISLERANELGADKVQFELADATKRDFAPEAFDVIYSRDTILHIPDKAALFKRFLTWLKPGGTLLISDYCCSPGEHTQAFKEYVAQRGYVLLSPAQYGQVLEQVGFVSVRAEDRTDQFVQCLKREVQRTESIKESFVEEFSQADYDAIVNGWRDKLGRCENGGNQRWGLFLARKPQK